MTDEALANDICLRFSGQTFSDHSDVSEWLYRQLTVAFTLIRNEAGDARIDSVLRTQLSGVALQAGTDALKIACTNKETAATVVDSVFRAVLHGLSASAIRSRTDAEKDTGQ